MATSRRGNEKLLVTVHALPLVGRLVASKPLLQPCLLLQPLRGKTRTSGREAGPSRQNIFLIRHFKEKPESRLYLPSGPTGRQAKAPKCSGSQQQWPIACCSRTVSFTLRGLWKQLLLQGSPAACPHLTSPLLLSAPSPHLTVSNPAQKPGPTYTFGHGIQPGAAAQVRKCSPQQPGRAVLRYVCC